MSICDTDTDGLPPTIRLPNSAQRLKEERGLRILLTHWKQYYYVPDTVCGLKLFSHFSPFFPLSIFLRPAGALRNQLISTTPAQLHAGQFEYNSHPLVQLVPGSEPRENILPPIFARADRAVFFLFFDLPYEVTDPKLVNSLI